MAKVVEITRGLRESTKEALDKGDSGGKTRPYYFSVPYNEKYECLIPLRSNCPKSNTLKINHSDKRKKNHGLDFAKMIIVERSNIGFVTIKSNLDSIASRDLDKKKSIIDIEVRRVVDQYKVIVEKIKRKIDLSRKERFLRMRTTLVNYHEQLEIQ